MLVLFCVFSYFPFTCTPRLAVILTHTLPPLALIDDAHDDDYYYLMIRRLPSTWTACGLAIVLSLMI